MSNEIQIVELSIGQLKEAMRTDCVTFLAFHLGDELTLEVPDLHIEIWDELVAMVRKVNLDTWVGHIQKLFCVPRGHAKSTLTKLAVILFLRYSRIRFALYASLTSNVAKAAAKDIVKWLTSDSSTHVWGENPKQMVEKANDTEQLWILNINTYEHGVKRVIIKALGADQQVRGTLIDNQRPELIVIDDCEDNDTAATDQSQTKLDTWLMGNLLKASARRSIRIMLGNMINNRTILYRLSKDPKWNPTVYGAIIRDKATGILKPLWPGLYTLAQLLEEYKEYRKIGAGHVWVYEMMNMTMESVFKTELSNAIRIPRPLPEQVTSGIITLDPAFGQKAWHDNAALVVHAKVEGSIIPHMVESRKGKWTEDQILDQLLELSFYWNLSTWGIESAAAQKLLIPLFKAMLKDRLLDPSLFTMIGLPNGGTAKNSRILAAARAVGAQSYGIVEEEEELFLAYSTFDPTIDNKNDDLPDAGAYGPIAWAQAGNQIDDAGRIKDLMALMQSNVDAQSVHQSNFVPY